MILWLRFQITCHTLYYPKALRKDNQCSLEEKQEVIKALIQLTNLIGKALQKRVRQFTPCKVGHIALEKAVDGSIIYQILNSYSNNKLELNVGQRKQLGDYVSSIKIPKIDLAFEMTSNIWKSSTTFPLGALYVF